MIDQTKKEKLIKLIDDLKFDHPVVEVLKDFVNSYDGTNVDDLNALVLSMVLFVMEVKEMEVRAEGYDAMLYDNKLYEDQMKNIKKNFDKLSSGGLPDEPLTTHP